MANFMRKPFGRDLISNLQRDIDRLFYPFTTQGESELTDVFLGDWVPKIDIKDEEKQYVIHADVPGVDPKEIDVKLENNILTIKGEKETKKEEKTKDYVHVERSKGSFMRRFTVPGTVDAENIKAKTKHGVLEITIPKTSAKETRKISVKAEE